MDLKNQIQKREIKFRAWQDNEMIIMPISGNYASHKFFGMLYEDAIVMQYTGLKDKNGVEIYEGDIMKTKRFRELTKIITETVSFEDGCFNTFSCFDITVNLSYHESLDIEIIGNIHENPELL